MPQHSLPQWFLLSPRGDALSLPYLESSPEPVGRRLPHQGWLVVDDATPDWIYKFSHWEQSTLAWNEIDVYARLRTLAQDSGIVRMLGISARGDYLVRVMERAPLGTLERVLRDRAYGDMAAPTAEQARKMLLAWAQSLAHLHAAGIVHRDVKAENILMFGASIDQDWSILHGKLSDFDRAVLMPPDSLIQAPVGSLFHMAPELHRQQPYGRKVDVYAFGILMFELMHAADRPYADVATGLPGAMTRDEFAVRVADAGYRPDWQHEDEGLRQLAEQCWSDKPEERPEFAQLVEALQGVQTSKAGGGNTQQASGSVGPCAESKPLHVLSGLKGVGVASHAGRVRRSMEDAAALLVDNDACILGVFDGMRGQRASDWAARVLPLLLRDALRLGQHGETDAWQHAFAHMQTILRRMSPALDCGSTATLACVDHRFIQVGWVGDSPAWLLRQSATPGDACEAISLMTAHHPGMPQEADRVLLCGARIRREKKMMDSGEELEWGPLRVYAPGATWGLSLTRALGSPALSSVLSSAPQLHRVARQENDRFLVLASDGVFDVLTIQQIGAQLMQASSVQQAASDIIDQVLERGAPDNSALIVMDLTALPRQ